MAKKQSSKSKTSKSNDPAMNCHRKHNIAIAILVSGAILLGLAFFLTKLENDTLEVETATLEQQYMLQNGQMQTLQSKMHALETAASGQTCTTTNACNGKTTGAIFKCNANGTQNDQGFRWCECSTSCNVVLR